MRECVDIGDLYKNKLTNVIYQVSWLSSEWLTGLTMVTLRDNKDIYWTLQLHYFLEQFDKI